MNDSAVDPVKSKIRMAILMKPGIKNKTWYSFLRYNNRPIDNIIANMKKNFLKTNLVNDVQVLQFYDNQTGVLLEQHQS